MRWGSYQGNPVYNGIWEQAGIDLARRRQIGVPTNESLLIVLGLAMPGQPDLPQPGNPCFADLHHTAVSVLPETSALC